MAASAANTAPLMRTTTAETAAQSDVAAFGRLKDPLQASQLGQELGGDNASTADSTGAHGTAAEAVALGHDDLSNSMPPSFVSVPAAPVPQAPAATTDDVSIELLIQSGGRQRLNLPHNALVEDVTARIYADWPGAWAEERPDSVTRLRLLCRGKILEPGTTLQYNNIRQGEVTVVHLNIRPSDAVAAEPVKPKKAAAKRSRDGHTGGCRCIVS